MNDSRPCPLTIATTLLLAGAALLMSASARAQAPDDVYVATYLDAQPAAARAGLAAVARYARAARSEAGNAAVTAVQETDRPGRFVLIEDWKDATAFAAHSAGATTSTLRDALQSHERSPWDQRQHHGFDLDTAQRAAHADALYVVTHVDVPAARREDAEALLKTLAAATRTQHGHVKFDVYQQLDPRTNHFTLLAVWDNRAAFDAYGESPAWRQFMQGITPLLGAPCDERLYHSVAR